MPLYGGQVHHRIRAKWTSLKAGMVQLLDLSLKFEVSAKDLRGKNLKFAKTTKDKPRKTQANLKNHYCPTNVG